MKWGKAGLCLCFAIILFLYWGVTRIELTPVRNLTVVAPRVISGDEPHYLMVLNSILFDHDLELQDDYERVSRGGLEAGSTFAGAHLDHHTILVNRRTGHHALALELLPGNSWSIGQRDPEFATGPEVYEVSAHPVGFPALLAMLIAPFRPSLVDVQRDASNAVVLISWAGVLFTFLIGCRVGMTQGSALFAALLVGFGSPWFAYARSYYSEPAIGLALAVSLYALEEDYLVIASLAVGAALWLKPPFVLIGVGFVLERLWARRFRDAGVMSLVIGCCCLLLVLYNYWLARTLVISGNGFLIARDFHSLYDTLLDPGHGLLIFAPWAVLALFPLGQALCTEPSRSSMLRRMALPIALYLILLVIDDQGPGTSYGPRYWIPFMPWLAIAAVETTSKSSHFRRILYAPLIVLGFAIAIPGALCYPDIFALPPSTAWHALF